MIDYREARSDDIDAIAELMHLAAGGISDFLLSKLVLGLSVTKLIAIALRDDQANFHFSNILVAEMDGKVVGVVHFYPANEHAIPDVMRTFVPKKRLAVFEAFYASKVKDSFYIHAIAVHPKFRNFSIDTDLFKFCKDMAIASGYDYLSAHVWQGNKISLNNLKMAGFVEIEKIAIEPHKLLPYKKGMVLLKSRKLVARKAVETSEEVWS
jgi:ribosomal protein S18 acetylase RimI-like enzyme